MKLAFEQSVLTAREVVALGCPRGCRIRPWTAEIEAGVKSFQAEVNLAG